MTQRDYRRNGNEARRTEPSSRAHVSTFTCEDEKSLSICVVEAVAEVRGTDPRDLQPLYDVIDPDALDTLFGTSRPLQRGSLTFRFAECDVTVDADGRIAVASRTAGEGNFE